MHRLYVSAGIGALTLAIVGGSAGVSVAGETSASAADSTADLAAVAAADPAAVAAADLAVVANPAAPAARDPGAVAAANPAAANLAAPAAANPAADSADQAEGFLGGQGSVPDNLKPPPGNTLSSVFKASGVQIYGCTNGAWTFIEPAASLTGITVHPVRFATAIHFRGPSWQSDQDGTLIEGMSPVSAPSATPNSIPQLLLTAKTTRGTGVFGGVTYVQRLDTVGGLAPVGACTDGTTTATRYRATYRFFKKTA